MLIEGLFIFYVFYLLEKEKKYIYMFPKLNKIKLRENNKNDSKNQT